jgi:hypothetical protein
MAVAQGVAILISCSFFIFGRGEGRKGVEALPPGR